MLNSLTLPRFVITGDFDTFSISFSKFFVPVFLLFLWFRSFSFDIAAVLETIGVMRGGPVAGLVSVLFKVKIPLCDTLLLFGKNFEFFFERDFCSVVSSKEVLSCSLLFVLDSLTVIKRIPFKRGVR